MPELAEQTENKQELARFIAKPNPLSIEIYTKRLDGATEIELSKEYNLVPSAIRYHLAKCRKFFGPAWQEYAVNKAKLLADKALKATEHNLDENKEQTTFLER